MKIKTFYENANLLDECVNEWLSINDVEIVKIVTKNDEEYVIVSFYYNDKPKNLLKIFTEPRNMEQWIADCIDTHVITNVEIVVSNSVATSNSSYRDKNVNNTQYFKVEYKVYPKSTQILLNNKL